MDQVPTKPPITPPPEVDKVPASAAPSPAVPKATATRVRLNTSVSSTRSSLALARASAGAREAVSRAHGVVASAREQAANVARHPAAQQFSTAAKAQVGNARELLGRSETIRRAEDVTGVDRVSLVLIAASLFTLLVPFNLFGLARPVTAFLAMAAPTYEAMRVLEGGSDASITNMLTYWVLFGFIMTIESLMGRLIERQFPRYHTCKLIILAYLSHPRRKGAEKLYSFVFGQKVPTPTTTPAAIPNVLPTGIPKRKVSAKYATGGDRGDISINPNGTSQVL